MSTRISYALAVLLLLVGTGLRLWNLATLPQGLNEDEITSILITNTVRRGEISVFYGVGGEGHEGLYHTVLAVVTAVVGNGPLGYRIFSVWLGMLTLAVVYALVRYLYSPLAALAALALLSVGMWPILQSRMVGPEAALALLTVSVLLALAYVLAPPRATYRNSGTAPFTALGLLLGIAFYVHPAGFLIGLLAMLFILYGIITRQPMSSRRLGYISFALVLMIVIMTPYIIASIRLPELAGAQRVFAGFADVGPLRALGRGLAGFFLVGDSNAVYNLPERPLIDLVSGLLAVVGLLVALRWWRQPRFALPLVATLVLLPARLVTTTSPSFLAFVPLLPLVALYFGVGVSTVYHSFPRQTRVVAQLGLLALLAFNIVWTARDLFMRWPRLEAVQTAYNSRIGQIAHYLDRTAGDIPTVVCATDLRPPDFATELTPAQLLSVLMHRQDAQLRYANCGTGLVLTNGGGIEQVVLPEENMLENIHSYVRGWLMQGEILNGQDLPAESIVRLNVADLLANTAGRFTTTAPVSFAPDAPGGVEVVLPPLRFGGNISFLGYEPLNTETYQPGDYVTVITYWRVDGSLPPDLRLFTHVLFDPETIAAQRDELSVLPSPLQPRDIFIQITFVRLPEVMPDDTYTVSVGAYENASGRRLPVFDGEQPRGERLFLSDIVVQRQ